MDEHGLPTLRDIEEAAERLAGRTVTTPLLESATLNATVGGRLLVKPEMLQVTGSFKFRGACNRLGRLNASELARGVVAFSSGNHAQGVAAAAWLAGAPAVIIMPDDAPRVKLEGTERWGPEIVTYDRRDPDSRERIAEAIVAERGGTLVKPYDDAYVMAGQGTAGLELVRQAKAQGIVLDAVLAPCGGGGLIAGIATAVRALSPTTEVYSVEPEAFDDTRRSLAAGERQRNTGDIGSICDALLAPRPGELTFQVNRRLLAGGLAVSDAEVVAAMQAAFQHLKLVAEPGGAVALAAALAGRFDCRDKTVVVVMSGGNVDPAQFARALAA
ncbi:MAG: threonine/serine dehydratase [Alphaproteobacteria bacterium]|nr:threonine/serine dehydratase [Alphaproteobacteria bacterium]